MTDAEMEEIRQYAGNFNCPIKAEEDSTTQKFCNLVCDEFQYDCPFAKVGLKLKAYEDAEENGMLIHLPCRVGDTVYYLWRCSDETTIVCPATVKEICIGTYMLRKTIKYNIEPKGNCGIIIKFYSSDWGDTIFTTREAAEQALAKMKGV